jgi:hypothetical protein
VARSQRPQVLICAGVMTTTLGALMGGTVDGKRQLSGTYSMRMTGSRR